MSNRRPFGKKFKKRLRKRCHQKHFPGRHFKRPRKSAYSKELGQRQNERSKEAELTVAAAAELAAESCPMIAKVLVVTKHDDLDQDGADVVIFLRNSMALVIQVKCHCSKEREEDHRAIHGHIVLFEVATPCATPPLEKIAGVIKRLIDERAKNFYNKDTRNEPVYRF